MSTERYGGLFKDAAGNFYGPEAEGAYNSKWSGPEPEITQDSPREDKLHWAKWRAHQEAWSVALSSMQQDLNLLGIEIDPAIWQLGMMEAMRGGEKAVWDFVDGLT